MNANFALDQDVIKLNKYLNIWKTSKNEISSPEILSFAQKIISETPLCFRDNDIAGMFLSLTGKSDFLLHLESREQRYAWAELACKIIRLSSYSLKNLFDDRTLEFADKTLFLDMSSAEPEKYTYKIIKQKIKEIAAAFYIIAEDEPRIALFNENNVEGACCDLACLFYDILDTPLNTHFDNEEIKEILSKLNVNIVVTDVEKRYRQLCSLREEYGLSYKILTTGKSIELNNKDLFLGKYCKRLNSEAINRALEQRPRKKIDDVATVMFTSGSTGQPKGVAFSIYNLVSKRFARAAALPKVGKNETLLCYLPLYHTFGRYLEMTGTIYWGGTYIFAGNTSTETLLSRFSNQNPTGFISIPLRWAQLKEKCEEEMTKFDSDEKKKEAFRSVTGANLRWGLSAAGYLDPKVFRFFENNGVELCSGFGMTEATGGITMTMPGKYIENSVGIPLPCIKTRLSYKGELFLSGDYVARYFEKYDNPEKLRIDINDGFQMPTGDIFKIDKNENYYIIDRLKDIYKNNKGQTIAPKKVENKFTGVPGIKRTFLVGDGREYNVLFIIPDYDDPVMQADQTKEEPKDYFHRIVSSANEGLATYERVVNFEILNRDFDISRNELSPKGSFKRKEITKNFSKEIEELYRKNYIELKIDGLVVKLPRWFYRNLGILEDDIIINETGLYNSARKKSLPFKKIRGQDRYIIGDLEYILKDREIDFSLFVRQPGLWAGNPSLLMFYPCIARWDINTGPVSPQVFLPEDCSKRYESAELSSVLDIRDHKLIEINKLICEILFGEDDTVMRALNAIGDTFEDADMRIKELIRRRLEAAARHPMENARCLAYRILLMEEPNPDYSKSFPAFVESGLSFLNNESIKSIALSKLGKRRLEYLRQRLFSYRTQLEWPGNTGTWEQFASVLKLLVDFVKYNPEYYSSVRAELASWILHTSCPNLSQTAAELFEDFADSFEQDLIESAKHLSVSEWESKLIFEENISDNEIEKLKSVLYGSAFLEESIMLAYDEFKFTGSEIAKKGIWVSKIVSNLYMQRYRFSINTISGKHFDLLVSLFNKEDRQKTLRLAYWYAAVAGYPFYPRVLPRLGCCRTKLGAVSTAYKSELTAWEKIREYSSSRQTKKGSFANVWRKLFIRSIVAFLRGWKNSGYKIVPGYISPTNVVAPELDFHDGPTIISLTGYYESEKALSIIKPIIDNFYYKTTANYPWSSSEIDVKWIFDACIEAFGKDFAIEFLNKLIAELEKNDLEYPPGASFREALNRYINEDLKRYYMPLPLINAVERYKKWERINPSASYIAKEDTINELYRLYHLSEYTEITRYYFYLLTYFAEAGEKITFAFNKLLERMDKEPETHALRMLELSDLQNEIAGEEDRDVFSRMIFPHSERKQKIDVFKTGEENDSQVGVKTYIVDKYNASYTIRRPVDPAEIGLLYRLFYIENYPKTISDRDKYYLAIDSQERIIGAICYIEMENEEILLDGTVVVSTLKGRRIGAKMLMDFCNRMFGKGKKVIKTNFYLQNFYESIGFKVDKRWGALVKILK